MAFSSGTNPNQMASRLSQAKYERELREDGEFGDRSVPTVQGVRMPGAASFINVSPQYERELREEVRELGDHSASTIPGVRVSGAGLLVNPESIPDLGIQGAASLVNHPVSIPGVRLRAVQTAAGSFANDLLAENVALREKVRRLHNFVVNAKIENAELYSEFGKLAGDWSETVKQINDMHEEQKKEYERRIRALEKTNEQLIKENQEMKQVIEDFKKLETEFERQKRMLRIGQIAYKLEILVSEYVFPGDDKSSKRARYGTNLKSLKEKINNLKNQELQKTAASRLEGLNEEMFEDWFLGIVKELKRGRNDTAHPDLGTYEEIRSVINEEFTDDDKREDTLKALQHLKEMYEKLNKNFGE